MNLEEHIERRPWLVIPLTVIPGLLGGWGLIGLMYWTGLAKWIGM